MGFSDNFVNDRAWCMAEIMPSNAPYIRLKYAMLNFAHKKMPPTPTLCLCFGRPSAATDKSKRLNLNEQKMISQP
jgi:hypothetical protein